jgi:hypothetical protein
VLISLMGIEERGIVGVPGTFCVSLIGIPGMPMSLIPGAVIFMPFLPGMLMPPVPGIFILPEPGIVIPVPGIFMLPVLGIGGTAGV